MSPRISRQPEITGFENTGTYHHTNLSKLVSDKGILNFNGPNGKVLEAPHFDSALQNSVLFLFNNQKNKGSRSPARFFSNFALRNRMKKIYMSAWISITPSKKDRHFSTEDLPTFILMSGYQWQIYCPLFCLQMTYFPLPQIIERSHRLSPVTWLFPFSFNKYHFWQCLIYSQQAETAPVLQIYSIINFLHASGFHSLSFLHYL